MHVVFVLISSLVAGPNMPEAQFDFLSTRKEPELFARYVVAASRLLAKENFDPATSRELIDAAIRSLYAHRKQPIPSVVQGRLDKLPNLAESDVGELLRAIYPEIHVARANGAEETLAIAIEAMGRRLEPGAPAGKENIVYTPAAKIRHVCGGWVQCAGVGLVIESDKATGMIRVVTPIYGSPAHKAGIGAGDIITHFKFHFDNDGELLPEPKLVSTRGMTRDQAADIIVGRPGTQIGFVIERPR